MTILNATQKHYDPSATSNPVANGKEMSKLTKKLERVGKILEKQFKHQIHSQFGQHLPKSFVKEMVHKKVESFLEVMINGELAATIDHDNAQIQKLMNTFPAQHPPKNEIYEVEGYRISITKESKSGWSAKIVEIEGGRRVKKIITPLPGQVGWNSLKHKILVKLVQEKLEHRHVHKAKEMSNKIVDNYSNSIVPSIVDGMVRGMENFSHSYKMAGNETLAGVGGYFAGAAIANGAMEMYEGAHQAHHSSIIKKELKDLKKANADEAKTKELDKISKKLRRQAIGRLMTGATTTIEGSSSLAYTALVHTTAVVAATSVVAAALGTTAGAMIIAGGLTAGAIHAHGLRKLNKRLKEVKKLESPSNEKLVHDFKNMQKRMLNNARLNKGLQLTGDTAAVAGGAVLIASIVTGAASVGIAAGAILGATLALYGTAVGVKAYKNYSYQQGQKEQILLDADLLANNRIDEMKSDLGIIIRLAEAVNIEQSELKGDDPKPLSELVTNYLGMEPKAFLKMTSSLKHELLSFAKDKIQKRMDGISHASITTTIEAVDAAA